MSLERLGGFSFVGRQSERSSAHEVSDGVGDQEDCTPHDERDTKQPEARRGVGVDPLIEVGELVLQHGSVPLQIRRDRESFYQFRIRGIDRCPVCQANEVTREVSLLWRQAT